MSMSKGMVVHNVLSVCLLLALCIPANCRTLSEQATTTTGSTASNGTVYYLDSKRPSITQPLDATTKDAEEAKFVQIAIATVQNPQKQALMFEVHYQPTSKQKIYLGTFSLYPPDNPGTFIVPTQGKLRNQGAIILSMVTIDNNDAASVKVGVKKLQLRKQ